MNLSKFQRILVVIFTLSLLDLGCSAHSAGSSPASAGALPKSWVNLNDKASADIEQSNADTIVTPDPTTDVAVQSAFQANLNALTQADDAQAAASTQNTTGNTRPSDWTPWHLDGMVGYYAISQGGWLGTLLYAGTESVKLTWQKVTAAVATPVAVTASTTAQQTPALRVVNSMAVGDLPAALEPSIQVAMASGKIQNESAFRTNLMAHAQRFLAVSQVLSSIPRASQWYVDGYQLNLSISASGQVTPLIGVGGAVNLYFDWSRTTDPTVVSSPTLSQPTSDVAAYSGELRDVVNLMSSVIPQAVADSAEVQQNGFHLDMIQVGLGVTAGGSIGIAQATGGSIGRIIFKRDITVSQSTTQAALATDPTQNLNVMPALANTAPAGFSYQVNAGKVRRSLKKAISMANYFATRAKNAENTRYHLNQIEAEFDMSLGGDLKVAVVNGVGQFVLDFDWIQ